MRLEMGLETRLQLQQKLVLAPQILQSIEILQMPYQNLLEFIDQQLMENEALERDTPDAPPVAEVTAKTAEDEDEGTPEPIAETERAPKSEYAPEEWDEYRSRKYSSEDGD